VLRSALLRAVLALAAAAPLAAQQPPASVSRLAGIEAAVIRVTAAHRDAIWPGFRPDTIPALFVLPDQGVLLLNWPAATPPDGFAPIPGLPRAGWQSASVRTAASTSTALAGRSAAQIFVYPEASDALLFGTVVHEAFHVFERSVARDGRRFGSAENSFLVSSYPIFDARNEAGVALEGRLLGRALDARRRAGAREAAREFVAAREARQRALTSEFADFETEAELNEGLAEYALVRSLQLAAADAALPWRGDAAAEVARRRGRLDSLTASSRQSLRFRFYATGPAMGLILDRLAGPAWRATLQADDRTLQEELAVASGYRDMERALLARAARAVDTAALGREARAAIGRLRATRRAQVDSILARPGLLVVVRADSLPGRGFGLCGIDPQNLLQVDSTVLLHTRWVRLCGGGLSGEFTTAAIQDKGAGTFTAAVGPEDSVEVSAGGSPVALRDGDAVTASAVKLVAPGAALDLARARVRRSGRSIEITPLPR